jgi:signal transduction histidine kinase/ligand-binding sensor domain-containing protein/DNA-binding response OmpR family regulator
MLINAPMKTCRSVCFTLLFSLISLCVKSEVYSFRHYKVEDGLSFNTARNIIQDRNGFIWIGTEDCLNRFDGYSFKIYRSSTTGGDNLASNYISSLFQGNQDLIYVGTDQGISTFNPLNEKFARFNFKTRDSIGITREVNNMLEDQNGNIWISTYGQGAFRYNPKTHDLEQFRTFTENSSQHAFDMVNTIYADSRNNIWLSTRSKEILLRFDSLANTFKPVNLHNSEGQNLAGNIFRILEDANHNMWLGMWDQGLVKLNPQTGEINFYLSPQKPGGIMHIHEIFEYKPGVLMIGSDDGLCIFNTSTYQHELITPSETDPSSLSDKFVYPIFKDREGGIWIGTYFGGVNYLPPSGRMFERYTHSQYTNSVSGNVIGGFTEDKDGNIWIASDDGGLNVLDAKTGQFKAFMPKASGNAISYYNIHGLCWDDNELWIGTYSAGLNRYDATTGQFKHYTSQAHNPNTIDGTSVYAVFKDSRRRIWVTTMSGINLYNRIDDSFIRMKSLGITTVDMEEDNNGMIWFATWGQGLYRYDIQKDVWTNFANRPNDPTSLAGNQVNCLMIDKRGYLWAGTTTGLCYYNADNQQFKTVTLNAPSNTICSIIDDDDALWLTTAKGLVRYNKINGNCQVFTQNDGLLSDQFIFNSGFKSSAGKIYIGTATGFNAFYPKNITSNSYVPPVVVNRLEIFNKEVAIADYGTLNEDSSDYKQIDLSYKDNVFSLGFVALSYNNPEKNKYAYKLEGFDIDWNEVSNQLKATYTNLPAGNYTFRVKASNNDGVWNNEGASILVVIHPPIWKTIPFKILYIITTIVIIVLLIRMQMLRADKKHRERIEQLNHEKEKEVYDAKISFFTMIAHEIRTPVSLIIGPLEKMMATQTNLPEGIKKDLNIIDRNSQRLLLLVNQLLDFRKAEQGALIINYARCNVYELLKSTYDRFLPLIEQHGIEFVFDCPDKNFDADIDQEFVNKMVSNLLSNALKFASSKIVLACRINLSASTFDIQVTDDGAGIADAEKEKIFEPFYQINPLHKSGTGIGLPLVKNLVDAHKGIMMVTDALPSGASFAITLPLRNSSMPLQKAVNQSETLNNKAQNSTKEVENTSLQSSDIQTDKPYLLIVEDNAEMRNFLCESFADEYQILSAEDGIDGLEKIKMAEISLVISDLMMPRMNGLEFCKTLKSNVLTSHIPIVMLTAKADIDSKIEGLNYGADAYIEKPFSIKFLKAQIRNLIESRKSLRSKYAEMPFVPINSIAGNSADEEFLSRMNSIIEQNISNIDFTIDMLAEQLNISRSGFFSKIKSLAGVTPNELIQVVRLKKAAELLSGNKYRINEVAYMVGYNDPSYFSKCFFKQFNIRPGDFINKYRNS